VVTDRASARRRPAWIPYSNGKELDLVSKRVGNFQYHPEWSALFDQLWVRGLAPIRERGLAQSLARDLGPKGIHIAWINVDGVIDLPNRDLALKKEDMLRPDAIAETYWHLAHQDPSAWTMELEVRPFKEKF